MKCCYCGSTSGPFHRDHIVPRSRGGPDASFNLAAACASCNSEKRDRTASEWLGERCPEALLRIEARVNARLRQDFSKRDAKKCGTRDPLVGKFFHSYQGHHLIWQGKVLSRAQGLYLCQLYEWVCGEPSDQKLVCAEDMGNWKFYDSREDWLEAYQRYEDRLPNSRPRWHRSHWPTLSPEDAIAAEQMEKVALGVFAAPPPPRPACREGGTL